ncbi:MAG: MBOAT family protein, partial [Blautia sp.]|nr:MBOAT family protein [Blautia sp.]
TFFDGKAIYLVNRNAERYLKETEGLSRAQKKDYKEKANKKAKGLLLLGVLSDLGILLVLKYFNFFAENANKGLRFLGFQLPMLHLLLPLGISFYTLQAVAYLVDIYRNKLKPDTNLGKFMLFMSFFPQIVQGPIARHAHLAHQLYEGHKFSYERFTFGLQLILWGWMKKLIIADRVMIPVGQIFDNYQQYTGLIVFLGAVLYGVQVYMDFSGGMDIARGVSQILGIELELNFRQPYFATSVEEFWRKWHITLGAWMRDYVFYPLSLSKSFASLSRKTRKIFGQFVGKRMPAFLASFIVYLLVGIWHGPEWKYLAYGVWNGMIIMISILLVNVYAKMRSVCGIRETAFTWRAFQMFRTFILMSMGRFFSRAGGFLPAVEMMARSAKQWYNLAFLVDGSLIRLGLDNANWILLLIALIVIFGVDCLHEKGVFIRGAIARQPLIFRWMIYIGAILILLVFGSYGPGYDSASFIYEQF